MEGGENVARENASLAKRGREGNTAVGILLLLLAWVIYPNSLPIAAGAALLALYLIFGRR